MAVPSAVLYSAVTVLVEAAESVTVKTALPAVAPTEVVTSATLSEGVTRGVLAVNASRIVPVAEPRESVALAGMVTFNWNVLLACPATVTAVSGTLIVVEVCPGRKKIAPETAV